MEYSFRLTCFTLVQRKDYKMVETRPVGFVLGCLVCCWLLLSSSPPSDSFFFPSMMTWAPCPHGVRTCGKKKREAGAEIDHFRPTDRTVEPAQ